MTALESAEGSSAGGDAVLIRGRDFTRRATVAFGDTPARDVEVLSDRELRVVAPAHLPGRVEVTVTTAGGTSNGAAYMFCP